MAWWQGGLGAHWNATNRQKVSVRSCCHAQTEEYSGCGPGYSLGPITQTCWPREEGEATHSPWGAHGSPGCSGLSQAPKASVSQANTSITMCSVSSGILSQGGKLNDCLAHLNLVF